MRGKRTEHSADLTPARRRLSLALLLAMTLSSGCALRPTPTPTPLLTPTPTVVDPLSLVSLEVRIYLLMVRPVTTDYAILEARYQPSSVMQALVEELDMVDPPPDMIEAHALLREGYQLLAEGTALLETDPGPELRSEAIFIQDWGVRQLWEHRRMVAEYLQQAASEQKQ